MVFTTLETFVLRCHSDFNLVACYEDLRAGFKDDFRFFSLDFKDSFGMYLHEEYTIWIPSRGVVWCDVQIYTPEELKSHYDKYSDEWSKKETTYSVCHNYIWGAVDFAEKEGLRPFRTFYVASCLLRPKDDPSVEKIPVSFGYEGKHVLTYADEFEEDILGDIFAKNLPDDQWMRMTNKEWRSVWGAYTKAEIKETEEYACEYEYDFEDYDVMRERKLAKFSRNYLWKYSDMVEERWEPEEGTSMGDNPHEWLLGQVNSIYEEVAFLEVPIIERRTRELPSSPESIEDGPLFRNLFTGKRKSREKGHYLDELLAHGDVYYGKIRDALWWSAHHAEKVASMTSPVPLYLLCLAQIDPKAAVDDILLFLHLEEKVLRRLFSDEDSQTWSLVFNRVFRGDVSPLRDLLFEPFVSEYAKCIVGKGLISILSIPNGALSSKYPRSDRKKVKEVVKEVLEAMVHELEICRPYIFSSGFALFFCSDVRDCTMIFDPILGRIVRTGRMMGMRATDGRYFFQERSYSRWEAPVPGKFKDDFLSLC